MRSKHVLLLCLLTFILTLAISIESSEIYRRELETCYAIVQDLPQRALR